MLERRRCDDRAGQREHAVGTAEDGRVRRGGVDGGESVGSGNDLRPCARMHAASFTPCLTRVPSETPGRGPSGQQLLTRVWADANAGDCVLISVPEN